MTVRWTEDAQLRLIEIRDYIAQDHPSAAERHVELLLTQAASLADFPSRGRMIPERPESGQRELIIKGYRLVYRVQGEVIQILTVFEGHRLLRDEELEE